MPEAAQANKKEARETEKKYGLRVCYLGSSEKATIRSHFVKQGVDPKLVEFAFDSALFPGKAYGVNRNFLQLASAGELSFSADDDTVCTPYGLKGYASTAQLSKASAAQDFTRFIDVEEMYEALEPINDSFLTFHERALGKNWLIYFLPLM